MAKKFKQRLPFDSDGGAVVFPKKLFESVAYCDLTPAAKCLIPLLQTFWRNERPVALGVREAALKIGCTPTTAGKALKMLQSHGFIVCANESLFNSKTGSKTREWRLTWMPFNGSNPTREWAAWRPP